MKAIIKNINSVHAQINETLKALIASRDNADYEKAQLRLRYLHLRMRQLSIELANASSHRVHHDEPRLSYNELYNVSGE